MFKIEHLPGEEAPRVVAMTEEEIATQQATARAAELREAQRLTQQTQQDSARTILSTYDVDAAKAVIDAATIPDEVKDVIKDLLTLVAALRTTRTSR